MFKNLTIGKFIRRIVLLALAAIIVILLLVFFLDRYKAQSFSNVDNIYDDDYFARENLKDNGFVFYSDYMNGIYDYYCLNQDATLKANYQTNLKAYLKTLGLQNYQKYNRNNFSKENSETTLLKVKELIQAGRYKDEASYLFSEYNSNIKNLNNELKAMVGFTAWVEESLGLPESFVDEVTQEKNSEDGKFYWFVNGVTTQIEVSSEDLYEDAKVSVNDFGYVVINETITTQIESITKTNASYTDASRLYNVDYVGVLEFIQAKCLQTATKEQVIAAISSDSYDDINVKTNEQKAVFGYLLKKDFDDNKDESYFSQGTEFYQSEYDNLSKVVDELKNISSSYLDEVKGSKPTWATYYSTVLLGYEGAANPTSTIKYELNDGTGRYYEVALNAYTTAFKFYLKDSKGNILSEWASNPDVVDDKVNQAIYQHSQFTIYYSSSRGRTLSFTNYEYSVSDHSINSNDSLTPNFAVKYDKENNKLLVWYQIEKREIDYTYFPRYISTTHMNELIERNKQLVEEGAEGVKLLETTKENGTLALTRLIKNFYTEIKRDNVANEFGIDYYEHQGNYENMSKLEREYLYRYLYQWCGYCAQAEDGSLIYPQEYDDEEMSDLEYDNKVFNQDISISKPEFSLAVEYSLNEDGLSVLIPGNSIQETTEYPVCYIDVLPYFTATASGVEGYTIIPDGSGEVLIHDNGNTAYSKYNKRVYTTDLTDTKYVNAGDTSDLLFPIYGVINENTYTDKYNSTGILTYITKNAASFGFTADPTRSDNYFNMNYYTLYVRENKDVIFGQAAYERTEFTKWTNVRNSEDTVLNYQILVGDDLSYNDIANAYKNVLIKNYDLEERDTTTNPTLDIDVIGMYTYKDNIAGIQYKAKNTLTSFEELQDMVNDLLGTGVQDINIAYLGWRNTGLANKSFRKIKVSSLCGSKAKFQALLSEYNADNNVSLYPYVDFIEYESFYESFGKYHYVAHAVDGNLSYRQPYDLSSNIFDKMKGKIYALSPRYYLTFAEKLADNYSKVSANASTLAIRSLGSTLVGDYKRNIETFKANAVEAQIEALDELTNNGIDKLTLYTPYDYAFKYVNVAKEIPYQGTQYEILDYSIPFYQLIVNGLFDYSGESINANSGKGLEEHIMRMIETGSNISFTFSYDSSEKLLQTDYNNYYYTLYTDWLKDVESVYKELNDLGIYSLRLTNHVRVASNIYKVTYSNGSKEINIYLNYTRSAYTALDGTKVPAKSYAVAK